MYNEYYCFGGVTLCLTGDAPWQPSDICQPFRIEGGPADHTIRVTVTDALPQPPKNADRQGRPTCRWRKEERFCLLQDYGGRYAAFAAREGDTTELRLSEGYRNTLSARVILESAGLFDLLADFGMLILHSAYIVTQEGEGILFSGPSGAGKSTQAELWRQYAGAQVINGDRSLIRPADGTAHGILYSGTSGICRNVSAPLRAIVLPVQAAENRKLLNIRDIVEFANTVPLEQVRPTLARQIEYNMAIAEEGIRGHYGAEIGKILLRSYGSSVQNRAKAYAAAGSDARMNGCEKPVVINSGSGNQGMTASIPVIIYAKECGASEETLYRALIISNLVTIHLKTGIGSLSAYCGATSAGAGAGAGICYLYGGQYDEIAHTIVNALAINSGMLCDGAKASCAAKIASAVEAGLLGMQMYMHDSQFYCGDGLVAKNVEETIQAVSAVAREGMRGTDEEIIHIMVHGA